MQSQIAETGRRLGAASVRDNRLAQSIGKDGRSFSPWPNDHVVRSFAGVVRVDLILRFEPAECEQHKKIGERKHKADVVVAESNCGAHDSGIELSLIHI